MNSINIVPLNRRVALRLELEDKKHCKYVRVETLPIEENREIWLEGVDFPLALVKQAFINFYEN